jgi:acyl-CoA synthetase (AMP-forming)/AMP-acid ligase II
MRAGCDHADRRLGAGLQAAGIAPGERVALLMPNCHLPARASRTRSLRHAIVGGDELALDVHRRFRDAVGFEATEVCGMTECFGYAMNPPFAPERLGSIGRASPGPELRLRDHRSRAGDR